MDSISQFVLGASLGEAVLGKKLGNKAILWGGLAGTIPDLDVLFMPFINDPAYALGFHRGFSHSFFFAVLMAPILGYLVAKWYNGHPSKTTFKEWALLFLLGLGTHPILDSFTTWGTQLFLPFSDMRVALNNMSVVDPLYTIPFLILLIACSFAAKEKPLRRILNNAALAVSCSYILFSFANQYYVKSVIKEALEDQKIEYSRFMTSPTIFNNLLWYMVVEDVEGYYLGFYSILDPDKNISFEFFERQAELIESWKDEYAVERAIWFCDGYYAVRDTEKGLALYDLKFGKADFQKKNGEIPNRFLFPFYFKEKDSGEVYFVQDDEDPTWEELKGFLSMIWLRIFQKVE